MSKFEVSIPYSELSSGQRNAYGIALALLLAVSALVYADFVVTIGGWLPLVTNLFVQTLYKIAFDALGVFIFFPTMAGLYLLFFRGKAEDTNIAITNKGLSFPGLAGSGLIRGFIDWDEITGISVSTNECDALTGPHSLRLLTKRGSPKSFKLKSMPPQGREKLFLALDTFAKQSERDANYLQYQNSLQKKLQKIDGASYTDLWEGELRRRFTSTSFVPLKPGSAVRTNSLIIERQLAFGGFAAIYLAKDSKGKQFVLKELALDETTQESNKKARDLFQREADLLSTVDHPQIVRVRDRFHEGGRDYLLLDYIHGSNLRQYVSANGPLSATKVAALALQMVSMLEYLHGLDPPIVHRDFTPDNLILSDDKTLALVDFGAANQFLGAITGTLIGKQSYMPPEQIRGKAVPASDLYALGGTLYFLITGEDPAVLNTLKPSERAMDVPQSLDDLIFNLTRLEVAQRANIAQVKVALQSMQTAMALPMME